MLPTIICSIHFAMMQVSETGWWLMGLCLCPFFENLGNVSYLLTDLFHHAVHLNHAAFQCCCRYELAGFPCRLLCLHPPRFLLYSASRQFVPKMPFHSFYNDRLRKIFSVVGFHSLMVFLIR